LTLFKLLLAGGGRDEVPDDDDEEARGEAGVEMVVETGVEMVVETGVEMVVETGVEMVVVLLFLSKILSSFPLLTRKEEDDATALELVPSPVMDFLRFVGWEGSFVEKVVVAVVGGWLLCLDRVVRRYRVRDILEGKAVDVEGTGVVLFLEGLVEVVETVVDLTVAPEAVVVLSSMWGGRECG